MAQETQHPFIVKEHVIAGTHVREYPNAVLDETCCLELCVKQYTPRDNLSPSPGDITIIFAPGIGFIKELYEPFFEEIYHRSIKDGFRIRNIWSADPVQIGKSGLRNATKLGNDHAWWDHSRDLLAMIDQFRTEMVQPMVGIGHSAGGNVLSYLSILHPRLLNSLVLIEPAISLGRRKEETLAMVNGILRRRNLTFPSITAASTALSRHPFYKTWDRHVFDRLIAHGLTSPSSSPVHFTTSPDLEAGLYFRANTRGVSTQGIEANTDLADIDAVPNCDPDAVWVAPFYTPEPKGVFDLLPKLRPWTLFVEAEDGYVSSQPEIREERLARTGTAVGGSGGARLGVVKQVVLEGGRHTLPFDEGFVGKVAEESAGWLRKAVGRWEMQRDRRREWEKLSVEERQKLDYDVERALVDIKKERGRRRREKSGKPQARL